VQPKTNALFVNILHYTLPTGSIMGINPRLV
jgi:hypothetical protein